jgi:hypothetical protein
MVTKRLSVLIAMLSLLSLFPKASSAQSGIVFPDAIPSTTGTYTRIGDRPSFKKPIQFLASSGQDQEKTTKLTDEEESLSTKLQVVDLKAGIKPDSFQRAVAKREIVDPNLAFINTAVNHEFCYGFDAPLVWKTWESPNVRYRPLLFEDENLERYGNHAGYYLQPYKSGLHYASRVVTLPYQLATQGCHDCEYGLGYFRPGNCNPAYHQRMERSKRGLIAQGLVVGAILGL